MCDCDTADWSPDDLIVPTVLPIGGFEPLMCCRCGKLLKSVRHQFREGSVCGNCFWGLSDSTILAYQEFRQGKAVGT